MVHAHTSVSYGSVGKDDINQKVFLANGDPIPVFLIANKVRPASEVQSSVTVGNASSVHHRAIWKNPSVPFRLLKVKPSRKSWGSAACRLSMRCMSVYVCRVNLASFRSINSYETSAKLNTGINEACDALARRIYDNNRRIQDFLAVQKQSEIAG